MDWLAWANTTANTTTAMAALQMQSHLAAIENRMQTNALRADLERWEQERRESLKEMVFRAGKSLQGLGAEADSEPIRTLVFAGVLLSSLSDTHVTTADFPELDWKERLISVRSDVAQIVQEITRRMDSAERRQAQRAVEAIIQMPHLERAIRGVEAADELQSVQGDLQKLAGRSFLSGLVALGGGASIVMGLCTTLTDGFGAAAGVGVGMLMLALWLWIASDASACHRLKERSRACQQSHMSQAERDRYKQMFGTLDLAALTAEKWRREGLIRRVMHGDDSDMNMLSV